MSHNSSSSDEETLPISQNNSSIRSKPARKRVPSTDDELNSSVNFSNKLSRDLKKIRLQPTGTPITSKNIIETTPTHTTAMANTNLTMSVTDSNEPSIPEPMIEEITIVDEEITKVSDIIIATDFQEFINVIEQVCSTNTNLPTSKLERLKVYDFGNKIGLDIENQKLNAILTRLSDTTIPATSPSSTIYRAIRDANNKLIRIDHHSRLLETSLATESIPRGLSLQRRVNVIGGSHILLIEIRKKQFKAEQELLTLMIHHYKTYKETIKTELNQYLTQSKNISRDKQGPLIARRIIDSEELIWQLTKRREKKSTPGTNRKKWKSKTKEPEAGTSTQN